MSLPMVRRQSQAAQIDTLVELSHENVVIMPGTGLRFFDRMSFDKWLHLGKVLSAVNASTAWCMGDWLIFGEHAYNGRYRDAIERTSLDYQTLRNYAWVARRFPLSRRRNTLSFGHHAEVAALPEPEQDFWLRKAEALGWSRNKMRREVKASLRERVKDDECEEVLPKAPGDPGESTGINGAVPSVEPHAGALAESSAERSPLGRSGLYLRVTAEQLRRCRVMAAKAGTSVEIWAIHTLDDASR